MEALKSSLPPRAVVVTRPSDYDSLLLRHGTRAQASFYLAGRGQSIEVAEGRHQRQHQALHLVLGAIPRHWRRAQVSRAALDRFLFEPGDLVLAVGQDGLVANVAKYLRGQCVVGVSPNKAVFGGVLCRHEAEEVGKLFSRFEQGTIKVEARTMVEAETGDGLRLVALNELYVGHRSHQSARYRLRVDARSERQSSSGLLVATGTGSSGWAQSVALRRQGCPGLPNPVAAELIYLVREAWPSAQSSAELVHGLLPPGGSLKVTSEMNDGGVCFGDGIETDFLELPYGQSLTIRQAETPLRLAV